MQQNHSLEEINCDFDSDTSPLLQFSPPSRTGRSRRHSLRRVDYRGRRNEELRTMAYSANDIEILLDEENQDSYETCGNSPLYAASTPCIFRFLEEDVPVVSPLLYVQRYHSRGGTIISTAFNLASCTLGAGTLALPQAMYSSGLGLGTLLVCFTCWCTIYSIFLLGWMQEHSGLSSIEELAHVFIGPVAAKLTAVGILLFCWGAAVMFVVMMGDFVAPIVVLLKPFIVLERYQAMCIFWGTVMLPLSLLRDVTSLQYSSIFCTVATLGLALSLFIRMRETPSELRYYDVAHFNISIIGAMSTFLFSYCCQPIALAAYREMHEKTIRKLTLSASYSMVACTAIYIVAGICGAIAYGGDVASNILVNFGNQLDKPYVLLSYIAMVCSVTVAFPTAIFPSRSSTLVLLGYSDPSKAPTWLLKGVGAVLALLALLLGFFLSNVRTLLDILGSVFGGSICFVLPGLFALRSQTFYPLERHHLIMARILVVLGLLMTLLGGYHALNSALTLSSGGS